MSGSDRPQPRILCAIVTYNEELARTAAYQSLLALPVHWRRRLEICSVANEGSQRCDQPKAMSSERRAVSDMPVLELRTHCNGGLALGYNLAIGQLRESSCDYILFLNSDSHVGTALLDAFAAKTANALPAALGPTLVSAGGIVSPFRKPGFGHLFWIIGFLFCHRSVFPAGFAFPAAYWLDGIDYWLSHELAQRGVQVMPLDVQIDHQLSVVQGFGSLPGWRYRNILAAEWSFLRDFSSRAAWARARLVVRAAGRCVLHGRTDLLREIIHAVAGKA
jgi:hypothetical protein